MDQTTDTATDLSETEKCLNTVKELSESDSDIEEEVAHDALLGGIRSGLNVITRTTRQALSTCKNKTELDDAIGKIEVSTLNLLRLEKSFLKTATIVSDVIDDLVSDFEDDDEVNERIAIYSEQGATASIDRIGSGDAGINCPRREPYIFRLSQNNLAAVADFKDKLSEEFNKRFDCYKNGLSETGLREDKKFMSLLAQIKLGKCDAEKFMADAEEEKEDDDEFDEKCATGPDSFLSSIPYSAEQLKGHNYTPYNEEEEMDDSVLPTVDPISKELIVSPLRNKFCNHVFDKMSIYNYIDTYPDEKCPMDKCRNQRKLERNHFVSDPVLTTHVRRKNFNI